MTHAPLEWSSDEIPADDYWGADISAASSNGSLHLHCVTRSLRSGGSNNDGVTALLLAGVQQELADLIGALPSSCNTTIEVHGANSPYMHPPEPGTAFHYWLRLHNGSHHEALLTYECAANAHGTVQCIQGLRAACHEWIRTLQAKQSASSVA